MFTITSEAVNPREKRRAVRFRLFQVQSRRSKGGWDPFPSKTLLFLHVRPLLLHHHEPSSPWMYQIQRCRSTYIVDMGVFDYVYSSWGRSPPWRQLVPSGLSRLTGFPEARRSLGPCRGWSLARDIDMELEERFRGLYF